MGASRRARAVVLAAAALLAGCGGTPTGAPDDPTSSPVTAQEQPSPGAAEASTAPECDDACRERAAARAERRARDRERCQAFVPQVGLVWRITATATPRGQEIGLRMRLANDSGVRLSGDTWGVLRTDGGRQQVIRWGGSSADVVWQRPGGASEREVWHERRPPGWRPVAEHVTSFSYDAYTYAPGRPTLVCHLPAVVTAPRGLVVAHPSGRWTQQPEP